MNILLQESPRGVAANLPPADSAQDEHQAQVVLLVIKTQGQSHWLLLVLQEWLLRTQIPLLSHIR